MDWKIFSTTFITIFIAEMGDKTQFAAFAASAQTKATVSVLLATVLALAIAGTLGVVGGSLVGQYVDPKKMKYFSGAAFMLMGLWILLEKSS